MKVKEAAKITGSMTRTSKMPGLSYSLPAWECKTGSKLRKIKKGRVPKRQIITKEEIIKFMEENFETEFG